MKSLKPMLGFNKAFDLADLKYPLLVSPKLDGIRCLAKDGVPLSRSLKPIPNRFVQAWFAENAQALEGLDGELIVGPANGESVYRDTMSGVMSHDGEPDFRFCVFDRWDMPNTPFTERLDSIIPVGDMYLRRVLNVYQQSVDSPEEVLQWDKDFVSQGFEGSILRYPDSLYKFGRSTLKEGALLKLKQFVDFEAVILDVIEAFVNDNEAQVDELGHTKRSSHQAGRTQGKGYVGRLTCLTEDGVEFGVGTFKGLTTEDKTRMWNERDRLIGQTAKISAMAYGTKDAPRHPKFLGLRHSIDGGK